MTNSKWVSKFFITTLGLFPVAVVLANVLVNSWQRALIIGGVAYVLLIAGTLLFVRWGQAVNRKKQIEERGEIVLTGETLTFRHPGKPPVSLTASNMLELWYEFSGYGWDSANSFVLIYTAGEKKERMEIAQTSDHFVEPLRSWCIAYLPNFDAAKLDSLRNLPGGDGDDILVWSRHATAIAPHVKPSTKEATNSILFYAIDKPYGCFSNFAPYPIVIDGLEWPTSEHYFQAAKMISAQDKEEIRKASTPFIAAQLGRERSRQIRADWDAVRESEMIRALRGKFEQHHQLKGILLSTAGARLVEHTSNDCYWGDGGDGSGQNRLGLALEHVRSELGAQQAQFYAPPWVMYPDIEVSDFFWKMGQGKDYLYASAIWKNSLSPAARKEYEAYYSIPKEWAATW